MWCSKDGRTAIFCLRIFQKKENQLGMRKTRFDNKIIEVCSLMYVGCFLNIEISRLSKCAASSDFLAIFGQISEWLPEIWNDFQSLFVDGPNFRKSNSSKKSCKKKMID